MRYARLQVGWEGRCGGSAGGRGGGRFSGLPLWCVLAYYYQLATSGYWESPLAYISISLPLCTCMHLIIHPTMYTYAFTRIVFNSYNMKRMKRKMTERAGPMHLKPPPTLLMAPPREQAAVRIHGRLLRGFLARIHNSKL